MLQHYFKQEESYAPDKGFLPLRMERPLLSRQKAPAESDYDDVSSFGKLIEESRPLKKEGYRRSISCRDVQQSSSEFDQWLQDNQHLFVEEESHTPDYFVSNSPSHDLEPRRRESRPYGRRNSNPSTGLERASFRLESSATGNFMAPTAVRSLVAPNPRPGIFAVNEPGMNPSSTMYQAAYGRPNYRQPVHGQSTNSRPSIEEDDDSMSSREFRTWLQEKQPRDGGLQETERTLPSLLDESMSSQEFRNWLQTNQLESLGSNEYDGDDNIEVPKPSYLHISPDDVMPSPLAAPKRVTTAPPGGRRRLAQKEQPSPLAAPKRVITAPPGDRRRMAYKEQPKFDSLPKELRPSPEDLYNEMIPLNHSSGASVKKILSDQKVVAAVLANQKVVAEDLKQRMVGDQPSFSSLPKELRPTSEDVFHKSGKNSVNIGSPSRHRGSSADKRKNLVRSLSKSVFIKAPKKLGSGTKKMISKFKSLRLGKA